MGYFKQTFIFIIYNLYSYMSYLKSEGKLIIFKKLNESFSTLAPCDKNSFCARVGRL